MELLIPSFLAGALTILAPCILTLLPVILGGSVEGRNPLRPLVITVSLGLSVIIFTLLLKGTTAFIGIPTMFWQIVSGVLIIFIGLTMLFPDVWEKISFKLGLYKAETMLGQNANRKGFGGEIILGASMGPVFTTCSPTYGLIIATVLPQDFATGFINIIAYTVGLMIPLLIIGYGGQVVVNKIKFAANPKGWIKRGIGALVIAVGLLIITGLDKDLETLILDTGYLGPIGIERDILGDRL